MEHYKKSDLTFKRILNSTKPPGSYGSGGFFMCSNDFWMQFVLFGSDYSNNNCLEQKKSFQKHSKDIIFKK